MAGSNPFFKPATKESRAISQRRSTRVALVTPIVLSGTDAARQPFREETRTQIVNLHGAKVETTTNVPIGMQVTVEVSRTERKAKAIVVWVGEKASDSPRHEIALQLLQPENLWGVEFPPEDWVMPGEKEVGIEAMKEVKEPPRSPAPPKFLEPPPPAAVKPPGTSPQAGEPSLDYLYMTLEEKCLQLIDYLLQGLRGQSEEILRGMLAKFEERANQIVSNAEGNLASRAEKAYEDSQAALLNLQADLVEELKVHTDELLETATETLRSKVVELFSTMGRAPGAAAPEKTPGQGKTQTPGLPRR